MQKKVVFFCQKVQNWAFFNQKRAKLRSHVAHPKNGRTHARFEGLFALKFSQHSLIKIAPQKFLIKLKNDKFLVSYFFNLHFLFEIYSKKERSCKILNCTCQVYSCFLFFLVCKTYTKICIYDRIIVVQRRWGEKQQQKMPIILCTSNMKYVDSIMKKRTRKKNLHYQPCCRGGGRSKY